MTRSEQKYESKEEVQTLGDSDMSVSNTSMEEVGDRMERSEQMSEDDDYQIMNQEGVRDPWEDDSILDNMKETENEQNNKDSEDIETDGSQSESSGDTIVPSESMDTGDKEYDPTTTESEESVVSAKCEKMRNKKQTTLTKTFGEKIKAKTAKATKVNNKNQRQ